MHLGRDYPDMKKRGAMRKFGESVAEKKGRCGKEKMFTVGPMFIEPRSSPCFSRIY